MSKVNQLWIEGRDEVVENFARRRITREVAIRQLARLGIEPDEASEWLAQVGRDFSVIEDAPQ